MDDQISRPVLRTLIDALDASARDLIEGRVIDAGTVQQEARRILAEFGKAHSGLEPRPVRKRRRPAKTA